MVVLGLMGACVAAAMEGCGWVRGGAGRLVVVGICSLEASWSAAALVMLGAAVATAAATGAVGWRVGGACWRMGTGTDASDNTSGSLVGGGQGAFRG